MFECPGCSKKFRLRIPQPVSEQPAEEAGPVVYGHLVVLENAFHFKQEIPLYEGENVVGRLVKGTKANAAIKTVDPSVDTTHCMVTVKPLPGGKAKFTLRDAPSNTGTFLHNELLGVKERVIISDGDIITIGATTMILREANDAGETE